MWNEYEFINDNTKRNKRTESIDILFVIGHTMQKKAEEKKKTMKTFKRIYYHRKYYL